MTEQEVYEAFEAETPVEAKIPGWHKCYITDVQVTCEPHEKVTSRILLSPIGRSLEFEEMSSSDFATRLRKA